MSLLLATTPEADEARRQVWLDRRRNVITSTDVPVLFDQGYYGSSPTKLFYEKTTGNSLFEPSERTETGKLMEPVIRARYEAMTGRKIVPADPYTLHVSEKYPWLGTSLDGLDSDGAIVELKNHSDYVSDVSDVPTGWLLQTQTQMLVMGVNLVRLAILCRGCETKIFDLEPHPVAEKILAKSKAFWDLVQAKVIPRPEFADDNDGIGLLFHDGGETLALGDDVLELCLQRAAGLDRKKELIAGIDLVEANLKYDLGNTQVGVFSDGSKVTWKADRNGKRSLRYYRAK